MRISSYLAAPLIAWAVAQVLKYVIQAIRSGNVLDFSYLYKSGNMPSAHSALMISLLVVVGAKDGIESGLFAVTLVVTTIILYDAMNVRRAVGEHGTVLKKILEAMKQDHVPFFAQGHTFAEVTVGSIIGFLSAVLVLQFI